ncbi:hypothetical protein WN51_04003 [Melipona quadrifasciata]|uniref:Uncharacterized protein n=1 Tax=Melipona quadrifasciata TaxID=166423 RepID=A0A0M8ZPX0_9HYME|nr:hypothetical protein WN51_04003 [Melipona quadrifasciata]
MQSEDQRMGLDLPLGVHGWLLLPPPPPICHTEQCGNMQPLPSDFLKIRLTMKLTVKPQSRSNGTLRQKIQFLFSSARFCRTFADLIYKSGNTTIELDKNLGEKISESAISAGRTRRYAGGV